MHHSFFGNGLTSCGKHIAKVGRHRVTGLDSAVMCNACLAQLAKYREHFPLASNEVDENNNPLMVGGAR